MLHKIENERLSCEITSLGAEIRSLLDKDTGKEYIWQIDQKIWRSSSPVLFPAIGKIKSDKIVYKSDYYDMPKHGIIRDNQNLIVKSYGDSKCSFTLNSSDKTLSQYPFRFTFEVIYELRDHQLIMSYCIINNDKVDMPFICGGHTAYSCPLNDDTELSDYIIEFPKKLDLMALTLGETGLLSDKKRNIASNINQLELSDDLFNEDALIFEDINIEWVRLKKKNESKGITVKFSGYPHLALWSKPGADYICIEPWLGLPDREEESIDITQKSTHKYLKPDEEFRIEIETVIEG